MNEQKMDQPLSPIEIEAIVEVIKQGSPEPFRQLVNHFQRRLHVYCYHMLNDREEAEDAVQDIFLRSFRQIDSYKPTVSFSAWLYKIAYRHCLSRIKLRKGHFRLLDYLMMNEPIPKEETMGFDSKDRIAELLKPLTLEERHLLLMRAVEERGYAEIAEIMKAKPVSLRKKYERLIKKISKQTTRKELSNDTELYSAKS